MGIVMGLADEITPEGKNFLFLIVLCVVGLWLMRLSTLVYKIHQLNVAISNGNLVRLPVDGSFGEMEMLWQSNMQQQLLRSKRVSPPIGVQQLSVPFNIEECSLKLVEDVEKGQTGVMFKYRSTCRVAVQLFWSVRVSALQQTVARFDHTSSGLDGRVSTHGRRKKRLFGQGYISVSASERSMGGTGSLGDSVESRAEGRTGAAATALATATAAAAAAATGQRAAAQPGGGGGSGGSGGGGGGGNGPLFGEGNCRCRSAVTMLGAATDSVGEFANPPTSMVPHLYGDLASERGGEQCIDDDEDDDGDDEGGASSQAVLQPEGGGGTRGNAEDQMAAAGAGAGADNRVHKLVIAVKVMDRPSSGDAGAASGEKEQERVSLVMYVVDVREGGRRDAGKVMVVKRRIVVTSRAAYSSKGLFGEADENTQEECVICLTDPKDTALLPCRHLCVCQNCFSRLDLCPVCRAPFAAYLRMPAKKEEEEAEASSPEGQHAIVVSTEG